jgi:hypothetical protein
MTPKEIEYAKKPRPFWRRIDDNGRAHRSRDNPPTHWRPMPAPPILLEESDA